MRSEMFRCYNVAMHFVETMILIIFLSCSKQIYGSLEIVISKEKKKREREGERKGLVIANG